MTATANTIDRETECRYCGFPRYAHWGSRPIVSGRCPGFKAVDIKPAELPAAPAAPDVNADMLAALRLACPVCEDAYEDARAFEKTAEGEAHPAESAQSTGAAKTAWMVVASAIASAEAPGPRNPFRDLAGDLVALAEGRASDLSSLAEDDDDADAKAERETEARDAWETVERARRMLAEPHATSCAEAAQASQDGGDEDAGEATPRMPVTSDIGFLIRDMIEGQSFELLDTGGDEVIKVGHDHVDSVDCSDIDNLRVYTRSGALFVVRIVREG